MVKKFHKIFNTIWLTKDFYKSFDLIYNNIDNTLNLDFQLSLFNHINCYKIKATEERILAFKTLWNLAKDKKW